MKASKEQQSKDAALIADFLKRKQSEITQEKDIKDEFSRFGGKSRSHLTYLENAEDAGLYVRLGHKYDEKYFVIDGMLLRVVKSYSKRASKTDTLRMYFRLNNGRELGEGTITLKINNKTAMMFSSRPEGAELIEAKRVTKANQKKNQNDDGYESFLDCFEFFEDISANHLRHSVLALKEKVEYIGLVKILITPGYERIKRYLLDIVEPNFAEYYIHIIKASIAEKSNLLVDYVFEKLEPHLNAEVIASFSEHKEEAGGKFFDYIQRRINAIDKLLLEDLLRNKPVSFCRIYKQGVLEVEDYMALLECAIDIKEINSIYSLLDDPNFNKIDEALSYVLNKKEIDVNALKVLLAKGGRFTLNSLKDKKLPDEVEFIFFCLTLHSKDKDLLSDLNGHITECFYFGWVLPADDQRHADIKKAEKEARLIQKNFASAKEALACMFPNKKNNKNRNLCAKDALGRTVLMLSVMDLNHEDVEDLLRRGADVNAKDSYGDTAINKAVRSADIKMIKIIAEHGVLLNDEVCEKLKIIAARTNDAVVVDCVDEFCINY